MSDPVVTNTLKNLSVLVQAGNSQLGENIIISLSSSSKGQDILISSGSSTSQTQPGPSCEWIGVGLYTKTPLGDLKLISTNIIFPYSVVVDLSGTQYTILEGISTDVPGGKLTVYDTSVIGAKVCMELTPVPPAEPPAPPPPAPPLGGIPPAPVLNTCVFPELSWNFVEVVQQSVTYISCNLANLLLQVGWIVSALVALIPQLIDGIAYFLSLKWINDGVQAFFIRWDIWWSNKFGIDPNLPFFDELVKKALARISSTLDDAAEKRMRERKW